MGANDDAAGLPRRSRKKSVTTRQSAPSFTIAGSPAKFSNRMLPGATRDYAYHLAARTRSPKRACLSPGHLHSWHAGGEDDRPAGQLRLYSNEIVRCRRALRAFRRGNRANHARPFAESRKGAAIARPFIRLRTRERKDLSSRSQFNFRFSATAHASNKCEGWRACCPEAKSEARASNCSASAWFVTRLRVGAYAVENLGQRIHCAPAHNFLIYNGQHKIRLQTRSPDRETISPQSQRFDASANDAESSALRANARRGAIRALISAIDKAAKRGIIHENAANRRKARLNKALRHPEIGCGTPS